ncbi:hypothetical protein [Parvibaculum sp.]|mgnify:CR=1 FL=1|jgi:hypothetical protein|uniref:hypothetical protein n=1 Tax=Parvibaculum sp. TaxID=2024848 RepID=UPI002FDB75C6
MNQLLLTQSEAALRALGVACQSASRYYETASNVTHNHWRDFAANRSVAYRDMSRRIAELLKREEVLPGSPDEDMEWLKEIALRAQAAISGDEAGTLLKGCARTEQKVWDALGEFGFAGIPAASDATMKELATLVTEGFLWLGREKEALLKQEEN